MPRNPDPHSAKPPGLSLTAWPTADQAAWEVALAPGIDVLDDQGPAAHWSPGSRRGARYGYGQWLGWLLRYDPAALEQHPEARVTRDRVAAYIADLQPRLSPTGLWNAIKHLYDAIRVISPDHDWTWLRDCAQRLSHGLRPARKADRMVTAERLKALGIDLMQDAWERIVGAERPARANLLAYRDGLVIALLACRPIRRRNLAMMRIGSHLVLDASGWRLAFTADETKNRQPIDMPMPADLNLGLNRWIECARPGFPGTRDHDGVWPSCKGVPLHHEALNDLVKHRTQAAFGRPINLHLFRDIAATQIAHNAPAQVRASRDLLGHTDLRTTERHYNQANSLAASRRYGAILDRIRAGGRLSR